MMLRADGTTTSYRRSVSAVVFGIGKSASFGVGVGDEILDLDLATYLDLVSVSAELFWRSRYLAINITGI